MSHYLKILFSALFVFSTLSLSANAAVENTTAVATTACNATGNIISAGKEDCRATPSTFTTQIYEIGLCTAHPYGAAKTSATFDASTCVVIYTDAAPAAVNLAAAIGTNTSFARHCVSASTGNLWFSIYQARNRFLGSWLIHEYSSWRVSNYLLQPRCWKSVNTTGPAVAQTDSLKTLIKTVTAQHALPDIRRSCCRRNYGRLHHRCFFYKKRTQEVNCWYL